MSSQIEIFMDWLSQPSRAVAIFCNINKIPTDISEVKVLKQQVRSQEYKKLNPSMKIPTIRDGTFVLYESHAILRYLAARENIPEFWYPKDIKARALVDQYLDWHHTNTRNAGTYIFHSTVLPMMGQQSRHKDEIIKKQFLFAFNIIEKVFLGNKPFIASRDQPTLADISCYCELMQMHLISFDFTPYPNIRDWMKRLAQQFPELIEGHEVFMKFVQKHGIQPKL